MKRVYLGFKKRKTSWLALLIIILSSFTIDQLTVGHIKESQSPEISAHEVRQVVVTRVVDGDTIEIDSGKKVRYIGMDTP